MKPLLLALALLPIAATADSGDPRQEPINPDRPGIADGSQVVGPGTFQAEIGLQREYRRRGRADERSLFVPALFRYGLDDRWEARIESDGYSRSRTFSPAAGVEKTSGYSPVSLGAKYHFQDAKPGNGRLSLGAILRLFPASGSSDFRTRHATGDLRLTADWSPSDRWAVNPNLGVALYEDGAGRAFAAGLGALTITYNPAKRLQPWIDAGVVGPEERSGRPSLILDGGVTYLIEQSTQLDFGVGTGLAGRTSPHPFWT
ncbi:MAG TPA: transporter, partial [Armatimonadota bacterium]|nr:transporter [Armatimonadota bacterium]